MKFLAITLIVHAPDPITGVQKSATGRFREVIGNALLDHLSDGRLELIIGKGNGAAQRGLFSVTPEDQWDRNAESCEIFQSDIAPVLRREIPDPPWPGETVADPALAGSAT
jgi:Luciferase-like monooxygenase